LPLEPLEPPQFHDASATTMDAARIEDRKVYLPVAKSDANQASKARTSSRKGLDSTAGD
jgi:hypothetical protein